MKNPIKTLKIPAEKIFNIITIIGGVVFLTSLSFILLVANFDKHQLIQIFAIGAFISIYLTGLIAFFWIMWAMFGATLTETMLFFLLLFFSIFHIENKWTQKILPKRET